METVGRSLATNSASGTTPRSPLHCLRTHAPSLYNATEVKSRQAGRGPQEAVRRGVGVTQGVPRRFGATRCAFISVRFRALFLSIPSRFHRRHFEGRLFLRRRQNDDPGAPLRRSCPGRACQIRDRLLLHLMVVLVAWDTLLPAVRKDCGASRRLPHGSDEKEGSFGQGEDAHIRNDGMMDSYVRSFLPIGSRAGLPRGCSFQSKARTRLSGDPSR